jgi:hypothetical protein
VVLVVFILTIRNRQRVVDVVEYFAGFLTVFDGSHFCKGLLRR